MTPALILAAAGPLLQRLGVLALEGLEDAAVVTDEERAAQVEHLLDRAERKARRAQDLGALGLHRAALAAWRAAADLQARARRRAAQLFPTSPPLLLVPET